MVRLIYFILLDLGTNIVILFFQLEIPLIELVFLLLAGQSLLPVSLLASRVVLFFLMHEPVAVIDILYPFVNASDLIC